MPLLSIISLVVILLLLCFGKSAVAADTPLLSFGVFADTHYAEKIYGDRYCSDAIVKLNACIDTFNSRKLPLAICLGDLIDSADDHAGEIHNLATVANVFATFRGERRFVVGNHDVARLTKAEFLQTIGAKPPAPYYAFTKEGVHFIVLDGNCLEDGSDFAAGNFSWDNAWVSTAQLKWLQTELGKNRHNPTIVIIHENLDRVQANGVLDPHSVRNAGSVRQLIEQADNVKAVIQGHYHAGASSSIHGIPYLTLSAMVTGPGVQHNAYGIVTLTRSGKVTLEGFRLQPSYTGSNL